MLGHRKQHFRPFVIGYPLLFGLTEFKWLHCTLYIFHQHFQGKLSTGLAKDIFYSKVYGPKWEKKKQRGRLRREISGGKIALINIIEIVDTTNSTVPLWAWLVLISFYSPIYEPINGPVNAGNIRCTVHEQDLREIVHMLCHKHTSMNAEVNACVSINHSIWGVAIGSTLMVVWIKGQILDALKLYAPFTQWQSHSCVLSKLCACMHARVFPFIC